MIGQSILHVGANEILSIRELSLVPKPPSILPLYCRNPTPSPAKVLSSTETHGLPGVLQCTACQRCPWVTLLSLRSQLFLPTPQGALLSLSCLQSWWLSELLWTPLWSIHLLWVQLPFRHHNTLSQMQLIQKRDFFSSLKTFSSCGLNFDEQLTPACTVTQVRNLGSSYCWLLQSGTVSYWLYLPHNSHISPLYSLKGSWANQMFLGLIYTSTHLVKPHHLSPLYWLPCFLSGSFF
jgi:hypothetical protein